MTLKFRDFKLQEKGLVNGKSECVDYVKISAPSLGRDSVLCGKIREGYELPGVITKGNVFIKFRTDRDKTTTDKGFSIEVNCHKPQESSGMEANCENEEVSQSQPILCNKFKLSLKAQTS